MIRQPAVAGLFYPDNKDVLLKMLTGFIKTCPDEENIVGLVSPHAGYVYSGMIAGETFSGIRVPDRVVILGPNHHGVGHPASVFPDGSWMTPLGEVYIDSDLSRRILERCSEMAGDILAHRHEHSLEVQLPFIQIKNPTTKIVPICLGQSPLDLLLRMGEELGRVLLETREDVLLVASSDMTHYESGETARKKDMNALEHLLSLDPEGLYRTVYHDRITMCGVIPAVVMLAAAKILGARRGRLVRYGNSGDVTGDQSQVVGYAGVHVL